MILLQHQDHSCVYTIDSDSHELYYAPIYEDESVNLSEFAPVDLAEYDDELEILSIQQQLIELNK